MRLLLSLAVMFVACAPVPRPTPEVMPEVAAQFGEIVNDWDEERMLALFSAERRTRGSSAATFTWLHAQLGECGAPEFMWSFANRGARFSYPCERGALEASIILDETGHIVSLRSAAAGIPAPPALLAAADALLASLPWTWDTKRPFEHNLNFYDALQLGQCELARPWVISQHGGLFHVRCNKGPAVLRLGLHDNGTISVAELLPADSYRGPSIEPQSTGQLAGPNADPNADPPA